jgi:glycosyltransferase involved in cell wall biosynthesis
MAYNEENNIVQILHALLNQNLDIAHIKEIVVVASGCTDQTVPLAQAIAQTHPLIKVEVQTERAGKAAAINHLINIAQGEVIVLVGADTLPDPTALENLVRPFADPTVGMTGARIVPLNDPRRFLGFVVQTLWHVHHRLALRSPKLGELVAFRNVVAALPVNSATDEVALEALITAQGYRLVYRPSAIVYNRGPQTLSDFLQQRRRIFAGHLHIAATQNYVAASMSLRPLARLTLETLTQYPALLFWIMAAMFLEGWGRVLGTLDFWVGEGHHIWRPIRSTKQVQQNNHSLTLVALQCRKGSVSANLMAKIHRIPDSQGTLFWWDAKRGQVLFILPNDQFTVESLEERINALANYIGTRDKISDNPVLSYRLVQFTAQTVGLAGLA